MLLLAGALAYADSSLGGVTISNVKTDLSNMTVSFTVANTTDEVLTAWVFQVVSIYGGDKDEQEWGDDALAAIDYRIAPGAHSNFTKPLTKVLVKRDQEELWDKFDPTTADVSIVAAVFDDNRALGSAKRLTSIEQRRELEFRVISTKMQMLQDIKNAPDRLAYIAKLTNNLTPLSALPAVTRSVEDQQASFRTTLLHNFLDRMGHAVTGLTAESHSAEIPAYLDEILHGLTQQRARVQGHTKLIRVEQ